MAKDKVKVPKYGITYQYRSTSCGSNSLYLSDSGYSTKKEAKADINLDVAGFFGEVNRPEIVQVSTAQLRKASEQGGWPGYHIQLRELTAKEGKRYDATLAAASKVVKKPTVDPGAVATDPDYYDNW